MKKQKLKKDLGLFGVYSIATGVTLSAGFFLLPGLAAVEVGSSLPLAYLLAGLLIAPGLVSMAELATAMPRAGGVYYFLDRSMGPLMGTVGGFGTWIALSLKSAFALIGIGAYLSLSFPEMNIRPISAAFAIVFGIVNLLGAKKSTAFQSVMVVGLLGLLAWFTSSGLMNIDPGNLAGMFRPDPGSLVSTAGLVVVSYMGLTQVASVAEEIQNPERNIPLGMFLAFATAILVYTVGTAVMVGVVSADVLAQDGGDLTPVATVANALVGPWGGILMTAAAVLAFSSVANAGILAASRYPLAMSRDNILPKPFSKILAQGTPIYSILATVGLILMLVLLFDATRIAKLAGAFQLLMFGLSCLAVMVMRESRIESYDPRFRSPFYPWLHILGVMAPFWLIVEMGVLPSLFTGGLITFGAMWYTYYARGRVNREGAIYHVFERLGRQRDEGLDRELRQIMKEKGLRDTDPFEEVVTKASIIDTPGGTGFRNVVWEASAHLAEACDLPAKELADGFLEGTVVGMTPVSHGVALPHLRLPEMESAHMVLVRCPGGVEMDVDLAEGYGDQSEPVQAVFFLVSPLDDPGQHLRILAHIAERVDREDFMEAWLSASNQQELKEAILRDDRLLTLTLEDGTPSESLIGRALKDILLSEGTLIALVRRGHDVVIPRGATVLQRGDRLTIIGEPAGLRALEERFKQQASSPEVS
jgi:amino acid transporter/mannitol/fructose-specific phosphotransferase system IIA component (Ntr-type)